MRQAPKWYRIDKSNGQIAHVGKDKARHAAAGHYDDSLAVLATGRFQTPFAIYALGTKITEAEWNHGTLPPPAGCGI